MSNHQLSEDQYWEKGWEGHQRAQAKRWAMLSFREKLLWLDEAQDQLDKLKTLDSGSSPE